MKRAPALAAGLVYINGGGAGLESAHAVRRLQGQRRLGVERGEYGLDEFLLTKSIVWSAR
jgi:acyl-CoA reductase-like NAD-dependent aldehyde dehydrogenase